MSPSPSATDTSTSAAQLLRRQGNAAFGSSRWQEAADLYTSALESSTQDASTAEAKADLATLHSNRAAARIKLLQLDLGASSSYLCSSPHVLVLTCTSSTYTALLDAAAAKHFNPTWTRPLAREAEAHLVLQDYSAAQASCASTLAPLHAVKTQ